MTLPELLAWIQRHDDWVYGLVWLYAVGKTGPLPMVAGYAAALGALQVGWLWALTVLGTLVGAQIRFAVGRHGSPWLFQRWPGAAPWVALASAGVERYHWAVLGGYRFVKGAFSLVGLGAGASLLPWRRHLWADGLGALLWASAMVGLGHGLGRLGAAFDPRVSAYVGLGLLVASVLFMVVAGRQIRKRLLPLAQTIHQTRDAAATRSAWSST